MDLKEAQKNIETAKRIIGRETEDPGSIWFGIAKSMVEIAEWAVGKVERVESDQRPTKSESDPNWPSYQEITSAWFGTDSEHVCYDGALRILNLFQRYVSTAQQKEPTTKSEPIAPFEPEKRPSTWIRFMTVLRQDGFSTQETRPVYMSDLQRLVTLIER